MAQARADLLATFQASDANSDLSLTKGEVAESIITSMDGNHDGAVSTDEWFVHFGATAPQNDSRTMAPATSSATSTLIGLAGSLIVGLLELFAGHGQNRFYRELEEWLSTITRLGLAEGEDGSNTDALAAVLDNLGDQMEGLQGLFLRSEEAREAVEGKLGNLADTIERLTDRMAAQNAVNSPIADALSRIADGQDALLARLSEEADGLDSESRMRLRSMDVQLLRILEEISAGRHETMAELRTDIAALSRVISQGQRFGQRPVPRPEQD